MNEYPLLNKINSPSDLKRLPSEDLPKLAEEVRAFLVERVSTMGGHLASNLGVVELTVALHRVFDTPTDHIIWDVGHQSYVHKLFTGRRDDFDTLRTPGGMSGFCRRSESTHDAFGAGHSSTSLSAAIGYADADKLTGSNAYSVAVVGDGAFTGGMIHEALNNCGSGTKLIAILNENEMSIGKTTGRFASYLSKMRNTASYYRLKRGTMKVLLRIPLIGRLLYKMALSIKIFFKNLVYGTNYYEGLGLLYMGPIDGHDIETLEKALREAKRRSSPVLVHIKTTKGKGYAPAEENPSGFHSVYPEATQTPTFHSVFGDILAQTAGRDDRITAITAAMESGTGLCRFAAEHPDRFFDVGIAEEHAVTFAAGLACGGMKPYVAIYSTFLQRAYDQILHDVALQGLPVRFIIDRAGLATADGATHHGIFDVSFLSSIPGITVYSPMTFGSLRELMGRMESISGPVALRYANEGENAEIAHGFYPDGKYENAGVLCDLDPDTADGVIIAYGSALTRALEAKRQLHLQDYRIEVICLEQLTPYPDIAARIYDMLPFDGPVIFVEDGVYRGGAGMNLSHELCERDPLLSERISVLAIRDDFASPEQPAELYEYCGISTDDIVRAAASGLDKKFYRPAPRTN